MPKSDGIAPPTSWGHSTVTTACPLDCPDSCSLSVTVQSGQIVKIDGNALTPSTNGYICGKVRRFDRRVYSEERIMFPQVRTGPKGSGTFKRVTWDEALELITIRMREAIDTHGAESILPYHYDGSNGLLTGDHEDARFFRRLGASRLAKTLCAAPTGAAAMSMYGKMAGIAYDDYEAARLIVIWGANPSSTGIHLIEHIKRAQKSGAKLVVVDPRRTALARQADLHLPVRPGTDLPVALAVIRALFEHGWADEAFIDTHTRGAGDLRRAAAPWTMEAAAHEAGVDVTALETFARWYGTTSPAVIRCGWGQERNRNGGAATMAILALPAIAGKFGVRGGGYSMSNSAAWGIRAETLIDVPSPTTRVINMNRLGHVLTTPQAPPISLLFVYNCNPVATVPAQNLVKRGLEREDLFTIVHEQVMTDTARYADLVLPATTFLEHYDIAKGYGAYHLHLVQPTIDAVGESRPNHDLFRELGTRFDLTTAESDLGEAGALIDATSRLSDAQRLAILDNGPAPAPGSGRPIQFVDVLPATADGKVDLFPASLAEERALYVYQPDPGTSAFPLSLISPASERTISSTLAEFRPGIAKLRLHPDDALKRTIEDGEAVRVFNELGEVHCEAMVTPEVRPGTVSLSKGLWMRSTYNGQTANALVPDSLTDFAGGACFNDARVEVELFGRH